MELVLGNYGYNAGGWRVEMHPRHVIDLTNDGRADILGFGNAGVYVSLNTGAGAFTQPALALGGFGYNQGWRVERHPRLLADLTGDGRPDIVGFGNAGVYVSKNTGNGSFAAAQLVLGNYGYTAGGWRVERHVRALADVTGDKKADIVGFGNAGVWVSKNKGDGTFDTPKLLLTNFGYDAGGWRVESHPRHVVDLTGDGRADILGFGNAGVWVSKNNGDGTFAAPALVLQNFGYNQGWRVENHPRILVDTTGDGRPDIVGFGNAGTYVAVNQGNGTFAAPVLAVADFGFDQGWRVDKHPRMLADLTGDGRADIVGFGDAGTYVSRNQGNGTFAAPVLAIPNFGYVSGGWRVGMHPRTLADLTGDKRADIVGFGNAGVWTALNRGNGTFPYTYVRRDAWKLQPSTTWHPVLLAYAKAVKAMRARPASDPTSWSYQAAIHGSTATPVKPLWNQCQHGSWYFLPWHRMYLQRFEEIVRAEVIRQGGPADWALPYWDYDDAGQAALPPAFRAATLPDGTPNPLLNTTRGPGWNAGQALPASVVDASAAMADNTYTPPPAPGFGGGITATPQHFFGAYGDLEFTPHNDVHSTIGGDMGDPDRAALDPVFWLHHANIDRLWSVWINDGHANPANPTWLGQAFQLFDASGTKVSAKVSDVLDSVTQLGYTYENVSTALTGLAADVLMAAAGTPEGGDGEVVGASSAPLVLAGRPVQAEVEIDARAVTDRTARLAAAADNAGRVYLNLEDIEAEQNPDVAYEVFMSVAGDETPYHVGNVSFFGIGRAHAGAHSFRRTFDVTGRVETLRSEGVWDDRGVTVTLRPALPLPPPGGLTDADAAAAAEARSRPVTIGRISVVYA